MTAMHITEISEGSGSKWYPDSRATAHVTNTTQRLSHSQPYHGSDTVLVGDGNFLPITHVGAASFPSISGNLPLKDVLVCPAIAKSLLSVSKLTTDYPCSFKFDCNGVRIKDKHTKKLLTMGRNREGLYMLEDPKFEVHYSTRQLTTSDEVWHMRLGHPNAKILQLLSQNKSIIINKSTNKLCESCQLGKSSRLPFLASSFSASKPLEMVHSDLWGPSPVVSVQGFRYYVIFIDNYSRFCWFYPLKLKSDFFSTFLKFQSLVENQFNSKIGSLQCDGGGEFTSKIFLNHLQNMGIRQLISCPHTPQQNSLAERKHRHITELGLSMMFESKMPQKYWVEAFFTSNFLRNLLPSSVLTNNISPYEALYGHKPNYTAMRTFGCACYPTLRDYAAHKFDPRSLKCVFMGYNERYKGYRCLFPSTGRIYISRHVVFDELLYPFDEIYSNLQPQGSTPLLAAWQSSFTSQTLPTLSETAVTETVTNLQSFTSVSLDDTAGKASESPSNTLETSTGLSIQSPEDTEIVLFQPEITLAEETMLAAKTTLSQPQEISELSSTAGERCTGCTTDIDFVPIGNITSYSLQDTQISDITQVSSATEPSHPMKTRSQACIRKSNP